MAISPSAIEKFLLCPRQYFWTYVMGEWDNDPPGPSTTAGKKVHAQLENGIDYDESWTADVFYNKKRDKFKFTTNKPDEPGWELVPYEFRIGRLAREMYKALPNDTVVAREHKFKTVVAGVEFSGIIDRLSADYLTDYKTTGSDLKYAKTSRKLLNDVQRLTYAAAFPDVPNSRWITGQWGTFEVQVAERENVPSDKEKFKLRVLQPAEAILALDKDADPLSFPLPGKPDYTGMVPRVCDAFGKICKFADRCFPKKRKKLTLPARTLSVQNWDVSPTDDLQESKPTVTLPGTGVSLSDERIQQTEAILQENGLRSGAQIGVVGYGWVTPDELKEYATTGEITRPVVMDKPETKTKVKYLVENLYIDCLPITKYPPGEFLEYSHEYIAAASSEVAGDMGVASPMLVDFGKGPHLVTAQLIAHLSDREEPIKHLFLETRSAEGRACMQELTSRSKIAIKGAY